MSYVPVFVPPPQPPSPRSRELADLLARVIVDFEEKHPTVTGQEVREATKLASKASRKGGEPAQLIGLVLAGLLALGVAAFFFVSRNAGGSGTEGIDPPVIIVGILIGIVALLAIKLRRDP